MYYRGESRLYRVTMVCCACSPVLMHDGAQHGTPLELAIDNRRKDVAAYLVAMGASTVALKQVLRVAFRMAYSRCIIHVAWLLALLCASSSLHA